MNDKKQYDKRLLMVCEVSLPESCLPSPGERVSSNSN